MGVRDGSVEPGPSWGDPTDFDVDNACGIPIVRGVSGAKGEGARALDLEDADIRVGGGWIPVPQRKGVIPFGQRTCVRGTRGTQAPAIRQSWLSTS